ncbi:flagellar basal body-associated protein FliL [Photobacterium aquae]|uniref:Flagellar protein FliL n=1 Tax=Photobacterium aquae TaxID=1195763 RepID=A0A0J1H1Z9_9GAMM|nr:flagellar basal body-associated FliL family protein [Photobacterium aquae]KLV05869.1 flagellar basal body-associated protein FliL [Photobacterium aquae]
MAIDAKKEERKKQLIVLAFTLLLIVVGSIGTWAVLENKKDGAREIIMGSNGRGSVEKAADVEGEAYYVTIPQPFIFNVLGDSQDRMVQISVQLLVRGKNNDRVAIQHLPLIESTLLQTFGAATVEQLRSPNGRTDLSRLAKTALQSTLLKVSGQQVVERVLFTGFVMQ